MWFLIGRVVVCDFAFFFKNIHSTVRLLIQLVLTFSICMLCANCNSKNEKSESDKVITTKTWEPEILKNYKDNKFNAALPDFSYAGYHYGGKKVPGLERQPTFDVTNFGAIPGDKLDDTAQIQSAIDEAGKSGGGVILFPPGKYLVNSDSNRFSNININYSNIVLRGAGKEKDGSIIYAVNKATKEKNPWLTPFILQTGLALHPMDNFFSVDDLPVTTRLTQDLKQGEIILHVSNTAGIRKNDQVIVAMANVTDEGKLIHSLIRPAEIKPVMTSVNEAGKNRAASYQWMVEVDEILDDNRIKLKRPVLQDIHIVFKAFVTKIEMLSEIGIEDLRFESGWDNEYIHHIDAEADYGWGAINLFRVANGWVKNIHIDNYTQNIHLFDSKNITIEQVEITGRGGHYGLKCYSHSCDNLIQEIKINDLRTHALSLEGNSYGNVFRCIDLGSTKSQNLDLHGMADAPLGFASHNLFEQITGAKAIIGGGALFNLPHSGRSNVFWDIEMEGYSIGENHEIFDSYLWRKKEYMNQNITRTDAHLMYPGSILVRVYHPLNTLTVNASAQNRENDTIYIEGLNALKKPLSLYETQKKLRAK